MQKNKNIPKSKSCQETLVGIQLLVIRSRWAKFFAKREYTESCKDIVARELGFNHL